MTHLVCRSGKRRRRRTRRRKIRGERIVYLLVGLEEGHYVVKWHGSRADSTSIPPLPTILVINWSLLTSLTFFSSLTVQSPGGGPPPLSHFYLILSIPSCLSSLTHSLTLSFFFLLSGSYISGKGQQNGPLRKSKQPGSLPCLAVDMCTSVLAHAWAPRLPAYSIPYIPPVEEAWRPHAERHNEQTSCS